MTGFETTVQSLARVTRERDEARGLLGGLTACAPAPLIRELVAIARGHR